MPADRVGLEQLSSSSGASAIIVVQPAGKRYPGLADTLATHVSERTNAIVPRELEYVERDRSAEGRTTM